MKSKLDQDWPPPEEKPGDGEATEILAPAGEGSRADEIRQSAGRITSRAPEGSRLIVLAILEVSAAIDRLTAEVRKKGD